MPAYFCESSAIVKRYVSETGTAWVTGLVKPAAGNQIYLANLTGVEVVAAIARRQRGDGLSPADAALALTDFQYDFAHDYSLIEVTPALIAHGMRLAEKHALRGYDAMQLAASLEARRLCQGRGLTLVVISADVELITAANQEGLTTDDPNTHP